MTIPTSRHFRLEPLASGVYAAIHQEGGWAIGNAGIIDLGDQTVIFDTFLGREATNDLKAAAEAITGRAAGLVINSHWHNDHVWGNEVFMPTPILATERTRELFFTEVRGEFEDARDHAARRLASARKRLDAATPDANQPDLREGVTFFEALVNGVEGMTLHPPTITFTDQITLHGLARSVEMITYGGGHTESDAILFLPEEGIVLMADLLFIGNHPYLSDGDPDETVRILDRVKELDAEVFVSGHGGVGGRNDLDRMAAYITTCQALARELIDAGGGDAEIDALPIPEPFADWGLSSFFPVNLRFLIKRIGR